MAAQICHSAEAGRIFSNRWKTAHLDAAYGIAGACLERWQQTSASRRHASADSFSRDKRDFLRFFGQQIISAGYEGPIRKMTAERAVHH